MDGSRVESRCERDFPCLSRPATSLILSLAKGGKAVFPEEVDHPHILHAPKLRKGSRLHLCIPLFPAWVTYVVALTLSGTPQRTQLWPMPVFLLYFLHIMTEPNKTATKLKKTEPVSQQVHYSMRQASWSSRQSFWLLIFRSRLRFPALPWEFFLKGRIPAVTMVWVDW